MDTALSDTGTAASRRYRWLRYAPPAAALSVAWLLQVAVVTDLLGTALLERYADTGIEPWVWVAVAAVFGIAVATSLEAGAAYLMWLYDRHLLARDSVWQLRVGMVLYVAVSAFVIHWYLGYRGLPEVIAVVLACMSASALWLWSRGARWAQRREMVAAGQIDPALPRLPMVSKVMHPVRWLTTVWLISWEPVDTTDEARERYAQWKARESVGGSSGAATSGTPTRSTKRPVSRRGAAAAGKSRGGGRGGRQPASSSGPSALQSPLSETTSQPSVQPEITRLARIGLERSWSGMSQDFLASEFRVKKQKAAEIQREMRRLLSSNGHVSSPPAADDVVVA